jgi:hypothetical protein
VDYRPVGVISFTDGSTPLGAATLSYGSAHFTVPPLAVGSHYITATFAGDANDFTSQYSFVQMIDLAPTSTKLATSNAVAQFAAPITLTAVVTGVSASTPTGNVNFMDGITVLATFPLNALGVAIYVNSSLTAGTHTVTAPTRVMRTIRAAHLPNYYGDHRPDPNSDRAFDEYDQFDLWLAGPPYRNCYCRWG